jgi:hypothetical protein
VTEVVVQVTGTISHPTSLATEMAAALTELSAAAARVASLTALGGWSTLGAAALPDLVADAVRAGDLAASSATVGVGVLHRSGALGALGYVSSTRWMENEVGSSRGDAAGMLARASALESDYPVTRAALLGSDITGAHAREIMRGIDSAVRGLPVEHIADQRAAAEQLLVDLARTCTVAQVRRAAARLRFVLDAEGTTAAALAAYEDQTLTVTAAGAMVRVDGWLDAEGGATVTTALDQIVQEWFRTGALSIDDRLPDGVDPDSADGRRQRRPRRSRLMALALVELARRQLDRGLLGSRHDVKPHVVLTADLADVVAGRGGEMLMPGHDDPVLVPSATVSRLLCDALVSALLTRRVDRTSAEGDTSGTMLRPRVGDAGAGGVESLETWIREHAHDVLYVGREHRIVPVRLRRALERRDCHCAFPGCRVDVSRTHAHHVLPWEVGGTTDIDNMVLLCSRHHHYVHEGGWTVTPSDRRPTETGYWTFTPPRRRP